MELIRIYLMKFPKIRLVEFAFVFKCKIGVINVLKRFYYLQEIIIKSKQNNMRIYFIKLPKISTNCIKQMYTRFIFWFKKRVRLSKFT